MSSHLANDDDNSSEQIFNKLEEYMFTRGNMAKYNKVFSAMIVEKIKEEKRNKMESQPILEKKKETHFIPFQKDKLFWSFYIILNGFEEYELHNSDHFITEKNFKIAAVEKLRYMKDELKDAKLKKSYMHYAYYIKYLLHIFMVANIVNFYILVVHHQNVELLLKLIKMKKVSDMILPKIL
jgi:hypothetical protein